MTSKRVTRTTRSKAATALSFAGVGLLAGSMFGSPSASAYNSTRLNMGTECAIFGVGVNGAGQLGSGTNGVGQFGIESTPVRYQLPSGVAPTQISPVLSTFVLTSDGKVLATGRNQTGQLGLGDTVSRNTPVEVPFPASLGLPDGDRVVEIEKDSTGSSVYYRMASGAVLGAGNNGAGQLGQGDPVDPFMFTSVVRIPHPLGSDGVPWTQIETNEFGSPGTALLDANGQLYFMGADSFNLTGGPRPSVGVPTAVELGSHEGSIVSFEVEGDQFIVLFSDGTARAVIGIGTDPSGVDIAIPNEMISSATVLPAIDTYGTATVYLLTQTGKVYAYGLDVFNAMGNGPSDLRVLPSEPTLIDFPEPVTRVVRNAAAWHTLFLTASGKVYGAGKDWYGQLGTGVALDPTVAREHTSPVLFQLPEGEVAVDAQNTFDASLIRTASGKVFLSGNNSPGAFGIGGPAVNADYPVPTPVMFPLPSGVTARSALLLSGSAEQYGNNVTVLGSDGNIYSAGSNNGLFGDGTAVPSSTVSVMNFPQGWAPREIVGRAVTSDAHSNLFPPYMFITACPIPPEVTTTTSTSTTSTSTTSTTTLPASTTAVVAPQFVEPVIIPAAVSTTTTVVPTTVAAAVAPSTVESALVPPTTATVAPAPVQAPVAAGAEVSDLALTGGSHRGLAALGGLLLSSGLAVLATDRRRRRTS
jgi:alpha-tubulin suppressor-like RCC1 family protein